MAADTGWRVGTTEIGFDGVWSQPYEVIAVFHDGKVVKTYDHIPWFLARLLGRLYILQNR